MANPSGKPGTGGSEADDPTRGAPMGEGDGVLSGAELGDLMHLALNPVDDDSGEFDVSNISTEAAVPLPEPPPESPEPPEEPEPPARPPRLRPADIIGGTRIAADRVQNRPTIVSDLRILVEKIGANPPRSTRAFVALLITEMLELFDSSELYAHPLRRLQFLAIVRDTLSPAGPDYDGAYTVFSQLEGLKLFDRRASMGQVRTATGWEPVAGSFDFDPASVQRAFSAQLAQMVSDAPVAPETLCGPEGLFDFAAFAPDKREVTQNITQIVEAVFNRVGHDGTDQVWTVDMYRDAALLIWQRINSDTLKLNDWSEADKNALAYEILRRVDGRNVSGQAFRVMLQNLLSGQEWNSFADRFYAILTNASGDEVNPHIFAKDRSYADPVYVDRIPSSNYTVVEDPTDPLKEIKRLIVKGENLAPWLFADLDLYEAEKGRPAFERMLTVFSVRLRMLGRDIDETLLDMPETQRPRRRQDCMRSFLANIDSTTPIGLRFRRFVIAIIGNGHYPENNPSLEPNERPNWSLFMARNVNTTMQKLESGPLSPPGPSSSPAARPPRVVEPNPKASLTVDEDDDESPEHQNSVEWSVYIQTCADYIFAEVETYEEEATPQAFKRMLVNFAYRVRAFAQAMPATWPPRYRAALAIKVKQRINGRTSYGEAMRMYAQGLLVTKLEPNFVLSVLNEDMRYNGQNIDWGIFDDPKRPSNHPEPKPYLPGDIAAKTSDIEHWLTDDIRIYHVEKDITANQNVVRLFRARVSTIAALSHIPPEEKVLLIDRICRHIDARSELGQRLRNWTRAELNGAFADPADTGYLDEKDNYRPHLFDPHLIHRQTIGPLPAHSIPLPHVSLPDVRELIGNEFSALEDFLFAGMEAYKTEGTPESSQAFADLFISKTAVVRKHFNEYRPENQAHRPEEINAFWRKVRSRLNNYNVVGQVLRRCAVMVNEPPGIVAKNRHKDLKAAVEFLYSLPRSCRTISDLDLKTDDFDMSDFGGDDGPKKADKVEVINGSNQEIPHGLFAPEVDRTAGTRHLRYEPNALLGWVFSNLDIYIYPASQAAENMPGAKALLSKRITVLIDALSRQPETADWSKESKASLLEELIRLAEVVDTEDNVAALVVEYQAKYPPSKDTSTRVITGPIRELKADEESASKSQAAEVANLLLAHEHGNEPASGYLPEFFHKLETVCHEGWLATTPRATAYEVCRNVLDRVDRTSDLYMDMTHVLEAYFQGRYEIYITYKDALKEKAKTTATKVGELLITPPLSADQTKAMSDDLFESVEENYVPGNQWQLGGNIFEIEVKLSHLHEQMGRAGHRTATNTALAQAGVAKIHGDSPIAQNLRRLTEDILRTGKTSPKTTNRLTALLTSSQLEVDTAMWQGGGENLMRTDEPLSPAKVRQVEERFCGPLYESIPTGQLDRKNMEVFLGTFQHTLATNDLLKPSSALVVNYVLHRVMSLIQDTTLGLELKKVVLLVSNGGTYDEKKEEFLTRVDRQKPSAQNIFTCAKCEQEQPPSPADALFKGLKFTGNREEFKDAILAFANNVTTFTDPQKAKLADSVVQRIKGQTAIAEELRLLVRESFAGLPVDDNLARISAIVAAPRDPDDWGIFGEAELARGFNFPKPPTDPAERNAYGWLKMMGTFVVEIESLGAATATWSPERRERLVPLIDEIKSGIHGDSLYAIEFRSMVEGVILGKPQEAFARIRKAEEELAAQIRRSRQFVDATGHTLSPKQKLIRKTKAYTEFAAQNIDWSIFGTPEDQMALPHKTEARPKPKDLESYYPDPDAFVERLFQGIHVEDDYLLGAAVKFFRNLESTLPADLARPYLADDAISPHKAQLLKLKKAVLQRVTEYPWGLRLRNIIGTYFSYNRPTNNGIGREYAVEKGQLITRLNTGVSIPATEMFIPEEFEEEFDFDYDPPTLQPGLSPEPTRPSGPPEMPAGMEPLPRHHTGDEMEPPLNPPLTGDITDLPGEVTPLDPLAPLNSAPFIPEAEGLPQGANLAEPTESVSEASASGDFSDLLRSSDDLSDPPAGPALSQDPVDLAFAATLAPAPAQSAALEAAPTEISEIFARVPALFTDLDRAHYPGEGDEALPAFQTMLLEFVHRLDALTLSAAALPTFGEDEKQALTDAVENWIGEGRMANDLKARLENVISEAPNRAATLRDAIQNGRVYSNPSEINWNIFRQPLKSLESLDEDELTAILQAIVPELPNPLPEKSSPEALAQFKGTLTAFVSNLENFMSQYDMKNAKPALKKDIYLRLFRSINFRIGFPIFLRMYVLQRVAQNIDPKTLQAQLKISSAINKQREAYWDFFDRSKLARPAAETVRDTIVEPQRLDQEALRLLSNTTLPNPDHYYDPDNQDEEEQRESYFRFINAFLSILPIIQGEIPRLEDLERFNVIVISRIDRGDLLGQKLSDYTKQAYLGVLNAEGARRPIDEMLSPDATPPYRLNWNIFGPTPPTGFTDPPPEMPPVI